MRKKTIISCMGIVMLMAGIGVNGAAVNAAEPFLQETESADAEKAGETQIASAQLPEEFFISYEVEDGEGTIESYSLARDGSGNIYYSSPKNETLFVLEDDRYSMYQKDGDGQFALKSNASYQENYVENYVDDIMEFVEKGRAAVYAGGSSIGESQVAGRECEEYEIKITFGNFVQQYLFSFDKDTGVCLKCENIKEISGIDLSDGESFICTRYDTSDISLSGYLEALSESSTI